MPEAYTSVQYMKSGASNASQPGAKALPIDSIGKAHQHSHSQK